MRPRLILFLGTDGSGKSTLAHLLCDYFSETGIPVHYIWFFQNEHSLLRRILRRFLSAKPAASESEELLDGKTAQKQMYRWILRNFYSPLIILDYFFFTIRKVTIPRMLQKDHFLVLDRYYYDIILAHSREFSLPKSEIPRFIQRLHAFFPHPDIILFLSVSPEDAIARKPLDYQTIERAREMQVMYQDLYHILKESGERIRNFNSSGSGELEIRALADEILCSTD